MILGTKILILGDTGAGKTTLAKDLSAKLSLPMHDLDDIYWEIKYSQVRTLSERSKMLLSVITKDKWIICGIPLDWNEPTLNFAHNILILKRTRIEETLRVIRRYSQLRKLEKTPKNLWTLITTIGNKLLLSSKTRSLLKKITEKYSNKLKVLQTDAQIHEFIRGARKQK